MRNVAGAPAAVGARPVPLTMKNNPLGISLCLLALTLHAPAETFVMKDGTKYEGKILHEDATTYVLEVHVTKSIRDERKVAKADVVKIEREVPVQNDFAAISGLLPVPDLQPAEEYAKRMRVVEKYLAEHRMTAKFKDAEAILATLKSESLEIAGGAIKLDGKLISPADFRLNQYDIEAHLQEGKIRALVKSGQALAAMRAFSKFSHEYRNTVAYHDLLPLMQQLISAYLTEAAANLASYDARVAKRTAGLQRQAAEDRRNTEQAIHAETSELERTFKAEKDAKQVWVTTHPFCKAALEDACSNGKQEYTRLTSKTDLNMDGGKAFRDAMTLIKAKGDSADAKPAILSAIAAAKSAWVPRRYLKLLEDAVPGGVAPPPATE